MARGITLKIQVLKDWLDWSKTNRPKPKQRENIENNIVKKEKRKF